MFKDIAEIRSIREQIAHLSKREKELTEPMLTDLDMIPVLYRWFTEIIAKRDCPPRPESVTQRKKFLYIVLSLYSPSALAGGKMKSGLREKVGEVWGLHGKSAVSDNLKNLVFHCQIYDEFKQDIEYIYKEIVERL